MKLQKRELMFIIGGVAIVAGLWLYQSFTAFAATPSGDSIGAMLGRIRAFDQLSKNLHAQADKLHVTIPVVGPAEQEARIRETLGKIAQSNGIQLGSIKRQDRGSRTAQSGIDFQLDAGGNYESALKFVNALESDKTPFQVTELRIEAGRAGGSRGGGPGGPGGPGGSGGPGNRGGGGQSNPDGNVQMSLKVRSYLFMQVIEEKKPPKPAETPAPSRPERGPQPETTPMPTPEMPQNGELPKETKKTTPTPTPTPAVEESAAPAPRPAGVRKFKMSVSGQSMSVSVEGRTASITLPDGTTQTHELTDEEYAKFEDGSFKDEITKNGGEITEE